jgi:hypothetical protein
MIDIEIEHKVNEFIILNEVNRKCGIKAHYNEHCSSIIDNLYNS